MTQRTLIHTLIPIVLIALGGTHAPVESGQGGPENLGAEPKVMEAASPATKTQAETRAQRFTVAAFHRSAIPSAASTKERRT